MKLLLYFVAGLFRLQKDWMNKTNLCELQRVVTKISTIIALLIRNDDLKILLFFIFYYMLSSFCHELNNSDSTHPTNCSIFLISMAKWIWTSPLRIMEKFPCWNFFKTKQIWKNHFLQIKSSQISNQIFKFKFTLVPLILYYIYMLKIDNKLVL